MKRIKFYGSYPENWPEIAEAIKSKNGYSCERCGHIHHWASGYVLTVHHLDGDKSNSADWNLACLCQRCHLHIQAKVNLFQSYMFAHSEWFLPHIEGFLKSREDKGG